MTLYSQERKEKKKKAFHHPFRFPSWWQNDYLPPSREAQERDGEERIGRRERERMMIEREGEISPNTRGGRHHEVRHYTFVRLVVVFFGLKTRMVWFHLR